MNNYPNPLFSMNNSRISFRMMSAISIIMTLLVVAHAFGYITWQSQEFTDAETTPWVWLTFALSIFSTLIAKNRFDGFLLTETSFVSIKTIPPLYRFKSKHKCTEILYSEIKKVTVARLSFFNENLENYTCKEMEEMLRVARINQTWKSMKYGPVLHILANNGKKIAMGFIVSKKEAAHFIEILRFRGVSVDFHENSFQTNIKELAVDLITGLFQRGLTPPVKNEKE